MRPQKIFIAFQKYQSNLEAMPLFMSIICLKK